jgi:hypothetical protein
MNMNASYNKFDNSTGGQGSLIGNWSEERALKELTGVSRVGSLNPRDWADCRSSGLRVAHESASATNVRKSIYKTSFQPFEDPSVYTLNKTFYNQRVKEVIFTDQTKSAIQIGDPDLKTDFTSSYDSFYPQHTYQSTPKADTQNLSYTR